jgi:hypothetical protein
MQGSTGKTRADKQGLAFEYFPGFKIGTSAGYPEFSLAKFASTPLPQGSLQNTWEILKSGM